MTGVSFAPNRTVPPRRVVAVVNPATRVGVAAVRSALEQARPAGAWLRIVETTEPGAAVRAAREAAEDADLVVAVGGDGTVADVASGLLGSGVLLGIVPAGSTNIVAQELGIPSGLRAAARLLFARHRTVRRDVGLSGDRCFLHMAGAGFDAHLFDRADPGLKRKVGWLAYLPAAADALREPPVHFAIETDDRRLAVESPLVLIANGGAVIHPLLRLNPAICPDDGWLDLLVFTATTPAAIARTVSEFATGRLAGSPDLIAVRTKTVRLATDPPVPVQFDGDVIGVTPVSVDVAPLAIEFAVPLR
jgi:YegS/Rv2252/BmrU family lipid kinase